MRFGIGEYSLPGRNSARFDAMQEFISALFRVIPNFGDDLTARLKPLSASAPTDPRISEEIEKWAKLKHLPTEFVIDGIGGFEFFDSPFRAGSRFTYPPDATVIDLGPGGIEIDCAGMMLSGETPTRGMPPYMGGPVAYAWFSALQEEPVTRDPATSDIPLEDSCPSGRFRFKHKGDDLARWTHKELEDSIRFKFEKKLKTWTQEIKDAAPAKGWTRNISQRRRRYVAASQGPESSDATAEVTRKHFDWLVQFQVPPCRTYKSIADDYDGLTEQAVAVAIRDASRRAEIPLRTGEQPGRPGPGRAASK